jgi:uncharacterized integral membrane protein
MEEQRPKPPRGDVPWSLIAFAVLALYAIVIVLLNREEVEIDFVFFSGSISKLVLILLCLGLGFAGGVLFDDWRRRRKSREP